MAARHAVRRASHARRRVGAGRLGARVPVAGAAHHAVPPDVAATWLESLLALDFRSAEDAPFAVAQLARRSGDRALDLDEASRRLARRSWPVPARQRSGRAESSRCRR